MRKKTTQRIKTPSQPEYYPSDHQVYLKTRRSALKAHETLQKFNGLGAEFQEFVHEHDAKSRKRTRNHSVDAFIEKRHGVGAAKAKHSQVQFHKEFLTRNEPIDQIGQRFEQLLAETRFQRNEGAELRRGN